MQFGNGTRRNKLIIHAFKITTYIQNKLLDTNLREKRLLIISNFASHAKIKFFLVPVTVVYSLKYAVFVFIFIKCCIF